MKSTVRTYKTVEPPEPKPPRRYIVVESDGDVIVAPQGPGKFEDSSCVDKPHPPVVFNDFEYAKKVADAFYVDSAGFFSYWTVRELPEGCTLEGMDLFQLPELASEAAKLRRVYEVDELPTSATYLSVTK